MPAALDTNAAPPSPQQQRQVALQLPPESPAKSPRSHSRRPPQSPSTTAAASTATAADPNRLFGACASSIRLFAIGR